MSTPVTPVRVGIIGCGGMARSHIQDMLKQTDTTRIVAIAEPFADNYKAAAALFTKAGLTPPPHEPDPSLFMEHYGDKLDAAFILTPHVFHHDQAVQCLEAGLDVLLEKPMVMTAGEARSLIQARDTTGKLLVVSFQGSLSPQIRTAVKMLRAGELGDILNINAVTWQNWGPGTVNTWRQKPELSGGGFMFDTGAHMLNTVSDLAGEDFVQVSAWLDNNNRPVDTRGVVMAKLRSGAMVTMNACGEAIPSCASDIWVFCTQGIVHTGQWGEKLEIQHAGEDNAKPVNVSASLGPWQQFLAVRAGKVPNPSPPEVGLRMARLWDAIKQSASRDGAAVRL